MKAWKYCLQKKGMIGLLYMSLLFFGLFIASPFYSYLEQTVGHSLAINQSVDGFDFTFIKDFLKRNKYSMKMLVIHSKWIIALFMLLSVFNQSAIVHILDIGKNKFRIGEFFKGGTKYFWRFLRLAVYFLFFYLIILWVFSLIFKAVVGGFSVFEIEDDTKMISCFYTLFVLFCIVLFLGMLIQDVCKLDIVKNERQFIWSNISRSANFVFKNILSFGSFYLIIFLSFATAMVFYHIIAPYFGADRIILFFLIGQIYLVFRISLKLVNLAGLDLLYKSKTNENTQVSA